MDCIGGSRCTLDSVDGFQSVMLTSDEKHEPNIIVTCACDQNLEATFYCERHDIVICQVCKTLEHLLCKTDTVKEKSARYVETEIRSLMETITELKKQNGYIIQNRKDNIKLITSMKAQILRKINTFRQDINQVLDRLEKDTCDKLEKIGSEESKELDDDISTCTMIDKLVKADINLLQDVMQTKETEKLFAADVRVSKRLKSYKESFERIVHKHVSPKFVFEKNITLIEKLRKLNGIGNVIAGNKREEKSSDEINKAANVFWEMQTEIRNSTSSRETQTDFKNSTLTRETQTEFKNSSLTREMQTEFKNSTLSRETQTEFKNSTLTRETQTEFKNSTLTRETQTEFKNSTLTRETQTEFKNSTLSRETQTEFKNSTLTRETQTEFRKSILNLKPEPFNIKYPKQETTPLISGCAFMPEGHVVLCDHTNHAIIKLNYSFLCLGTLKLTQQPYDIAVMNSNVAIFTCPDNKQLQYIELAPRLKIDKVVTLDKKCWGIEIADDLIYITCHNEIKVGKRDGEVRILHSNGSFIRKLGVEPDGSYKFCWPLYISVNPRSSKVFVSDGWNGKITCMDLRGSVVYESNDHGLNWVRGMCVDDEDHIIVCDRKSSRVNILTDSGKAYYSIVTPSDGIDCPQSIAYRKKDSVIIIGSRDSNYVYAKWLNIDERSLSTSQH